MAAAPEILPSDFVPEMLIKVGRFTCDTRAATRKLLGKGNFAAVYRAVSEDGAIVSAVKVSSEQYLLKKHKALDRVLGMMRAETAIIKKLKHPNIMSFIDEAEVEGDAKSGRLYCFALEYCSSDLEKMIRVSKKPLNNLTAIRLMSNMCGALNFLALNGVLHRDIKPENILVVDSPDGQKIFKLSDFGFAKQNSLGLTGLGSPLFEAPEIFASMEYSHEVDVFSMGLTFLWALHDELGYHVLAEKLSRAAPMQLPALYKEWDTNDSKGFFTNLPKFLTSNAPGVKEVIVKVLQGMIRFSPHNRFNPAQLKSIVVRLDSPLVVQDMLTLDEAHVYLMPDADFSDTFNGAQIVAALRSGLAIKDNETLILWDSNNLILAETTKSFGFLQLIRSKLWYLRGADLMTFAEKNAVLEAKLKGDTDTNHADAKFNFSIQQAAFAALQKMARNRKDHQKKSIQVYEATVNDAVRTIKSRNEQLESITASLSTLSEGFQVMIKDQVADATSEIAQLDDTIAKLAASMDGEKARVKLFVDACDGVLNNTKDTSQAVLKNMKAIQSQALMAKVARTAAEREQIQRVIDKTESEMPHNIIVCANEQFARISSHNLAFSEFNAPNLGDLVSRLTRLEGDLFPLATLAGVISSLNVPAKTATTQVIEVGIDPATAERLKDVERELALERQRADAYQNDYFKSLEAEIQKRVKLEEDLEYIQRSMRSSTF